MKKLKNTKPKLSVPVLLISAVLVFAYFWFIDGDKVHIIVAAAIEPVAFVFALYTMQLEKKADKKAAVKNSLLKDEHYFKSPEWRQEYYDYVQSHGWDNIRKKSMTADMCKLCHNGNDRAMMTMGVFFIGCGIALLFSPLPFTFQFLLANSTFILLGGFCLYTGINKYFGISIRKWSKTLGSENEKVEASYMNGHLLVFEDNSINIGRTYVVIVQHKKASYCRLSDIADIKRKIVRLKKYQNSTYAGEIYQHFVDISLADGTSLSCMLNEYQVEMAIGELHKLTSLNAGKTGDIGEKYENQVITP
ncbi:MAG: hypothetical protein K5979_05130 [Ruminococcus sp.]|nr:hypothetical protein [Ruminococcus sp.]